MRLRVDAHSPISIWQLTEQLKHVIEGGGVPRDEALPSIRELAGFLGINPNTVTHAIEDLKRSGHVETRRGKGVFVASALPARLFPTRREDFLKDAVIRAAVLEMTPNDVAVGVLSVAGVGLAALRGAVAVLLVECSPRSSTSLAGDSRRTYRSAWTRCSSRTWPPLSDGRRGPITGPPRSPALAISRR